MKRRRNAFDAFDDSDDDKSQPPPSDCGPRKLSTRPPPLKRRRPNSFVTFGSRARPAPRSRTVERFDTSGGGGSGMLNDLALYGKSSKSEKSSSGGSDRLQDLVEDHLRSLAGSSSAPSASSAAVASGTSRRPAQLFQRSEAQLAESASSQQQQQQQSSSSSSFRFPELPPIVSNLLQRAGDDLEPQSSSTPPPPPRFPDLLPHPALLQNLRSLHIVLPRPVQARALPPILQGRDTVVISPPGSGKSLATLGPLLLHCVRNRRAHFRWVRKVRRRAEKRKRKKKKGCPFSRTCFPLGVVLAPSRELAMQLFVLLKKLGRGVVGADVGSARKQRERDANSNSNHNSAIVMLVGMADKNAQVRRLIGHVKVRPKSSLSSSSSTAGAGADAASSAAPRISGVTPLLVVGTPGRILDLCAVGRKKNAVLSLSAVSFFVCDEADQLLGSQFSQQVQALLSLMSRPDRQTVVLSSAPIPPRSIRLREGFVDAMTTMDSSAAASIPSEVVQSVRVVDSEQDKLKVIEGILRRIVREQLPGGVLLFVSTQAKADEIAHHLCQCGLRTRSLHSGKAVAERESALLSFRTLSVQFLTCTDVAARGIDVPHVRTVIHVDGPRKLNMAIYASRIGRACRRLLQQGSSSSGGGGVRSFALLLATESSYASKLVVARRAANQEPDESLLRVAGRGESGSIQKAALVAPVSTPAASASSFVPPPPPPPSASLPASRPSVSISSGKPKKPKRMVFYQSPSDAPIAGAASGEVPGMVSALTTAFQKRFVYSGKKTFGDSNSRIVIVPPREGPSQGDIGNDLSWIED